VIFDIRSVMVEANFSNVMDEELLSVSQAAQIKKVSRNAIYKAVNEGRLASMLIVGRLVLRKTDVEAWTPRARTGRRKGTATSEVAKAKISQSQRLRWQKRKEQEK
jgi:excisionase family DNA binding protein